MNHNVTLEWIIDKIRYEVVVPDSRHIEFLRKCLLEDLKVKDEDNCSLGCCCCIHAVSNKRFACFRFNLEFDCNKTCRFFEDKDKSKGKGGRFLW